jgi:hypothetical protein
MLRTRAISGSGVGRFQPNGGMKITPGSAPKKLKFLASLLCQHPT